MDNSPRGFSDEHSHHRLYTDLIIHRCGIRRPDRETNFVEVAIALGCICCEVNNTSTYGVSGPVGGDRPHRHHLIDQSLLAIGSGNPARLAKPPGRTPATGNNGQRCLLSLDGQ